MLPAGHDDVVHWLHFPLHQMSSIRTAMCEKYLARITGRLGHFTVLPIDGDQLAVFRRLSFILPDQTSMIRVRLGAEVVPMPRTSVSNGFFVGTVSVSEKGRLTKRLSAGEERLLKYLLAEPMGTLGCARPEKETYRFHYPAAFVQLLVARFLDLAPQSSVTASAAGWIITSPQGTVMEVARYREQLLLRCSRRFLGDILRLDQAGLDQLHHLSRPCLTLAFGRVIDVSQSISLWNARQAQLPDRVFEVLFQNYEKLREQWLGGGERSLSLLQELPEVSGIPAPPPFSVSNQFVRKLSREQHCFLRDCLQPEQIAGFAEFKSLSGRISAPDPAIYPPMWMPDNFFNALAMLDFDPALACEMVTGGFLHWMTLSGSRKGRMQITPRKSNPETYAPFWALVVERIYSRTGDSIWLSQVLQFLVLNDAYLDRHCRVGDVYARGVNCFWNDYSTGPKVLPGIASVGFNALAAVQKWTLARLHKALGLPFRHLEASARRFETVFNRRFWNRRAGFYFDYDTSRQEPYSTPASSSFFGLDNLLPLTAGIVPAARVKGMVRYLRSSRFYGRYPAITTDLSPDFMDERRLMVWPMTNWLIIQGLRRYQLDDLADSMARHIFAAMVGAWKNHRALPESLSATHGLAPMENENLAGVGCWAAFRLYLSEVQSSRLSS